MELSADPQSVLDRVIACLWSIWGSRNSLIFSNHFISPETIIDRAMEFVSSFQHAQMNLGSTGVRTIEHPSRWQPPDLGWLKLNIDASLTRNGAGYGFVLRDSSGRVLILGSGPMYDITGPEHGELMALWFSWNCIQHYWNHPILIATDSQKLATQLLSFEQNFSNLGGLIEQLKEHLQIT